MKPKVFIVEDESIVAKDIEMCLKKLNYQVVGRAATGEKAIQQVAKMHPDIILMDIMLKGSMNGIECASKISRVQNVPIIYLTAYADKSTLEKAKMTDSYGYIIKPFKEIDLHTTIEMALHKHRRDKQIRKERDILNAMVQKTSSSEVIFIKSNSRLVKLYTHQIVFLEALKDYVVVHTVDKSYTIHSTMKDIYTKLPEKEFIRVHRSYIVRFDKILSIDQSNIILEGEQAPIPIGGSFKEKLNRMVNLV